ncbi:hypothetical protein D3C80_1666580 [compost metagenome]
MRGTVDEGKIKPLLVHALVKIGTGIDGDIDHDARESLGETLENARQQATLPNILRCAETHHAGKLGHDETRHGFIGQRDHTARIGQKRLPMRRQCHRAGISQEQRRLQLLFELLDLHGNG